MKKEELKKLILTAGGARKADTVIKNCKVVNVFSGKIVEGDIALCGDQIAGIGEYEGEVEIDAEGRYAAPGFIDSHIHIESSYLSPEELGRLLVPHGGTTIIADPHEIVNVLGIPPPHTGPQCRPLHLHGKSQESRREINGKEPCGQIKHYKSHQE